MIKLQPISNYNMDKRPTEINFHITRTVNMQNEPSQVHLCCCMNSGSKVIYKVLTAVAMGITGM
jgi:hypothetical protein